MFYVDKRKKTPLFEQLYLNISSFISDGSLPAGTCLPPTRKLAQELDISRTTVLAAYEQLAAEGYISSKIGSGYTVNDLNYRSELILPLKQQKKKMVLVNLLVFNLKIYTGSWTMHCFLMQNGDVVC